MSTPSSYQRTTRYCVMKSMTLKTDKHLYEFKKSNKKTTKSDRDIWGIKGRTIIPLPHICFQA